MAWIKSQIHTQIKLSTDREDAGNLAREDPAQREVARETNGPILSIPDSLILKTRLLYRSEAGSRDIKQLEQVKNPIIYNELQIQTQAGFLTQT